MLTSTISFIILFLMSTLVTYAQHENFISLPNRAQISLKKRSFIILDDSELNLIDYTKNDKTSISKVYVKVAKSDLVLSKSRNIIQEPNEILNEGFEMDFPTGNWELSGNPTWGKDDFKPYNGGFSAWCASGGSNGLDPEFNNYTNNCNSVMIYGPFSLKDIDGSEVSFYYWLKSEINYDWFLYLTSVDGDSFVGKGVSGDTNGWEFEVINFNYVPELGSITGRDSIWIAFAFSSDASGTEKGVFVDDVSILRSAWYLQESNTLSTLNSVYFTDEKTGWAVGNEGAIIKTEDGGNNWIYKSGRLYSVFFINSNIGWAVGNGFIIKTIDGGKTWITQKSPVKDDFFSICFIDSNNGWITGAGGILLKTIDGGSTWIVQKIPNYGWLKSIYFVDSNNGWIVGSRGTILQTTNGGKTWDVLAGDLPLNYLFDVYFLDENIGWVVGVDEKNSLIKKTIDGGINWERQYIQTSTILKSVYFIDEQTGWIVGDGGTILHTIDGGDNWYIQISGTTHGLNSVSFIDSNNGYAVGYNGTILYTVDAGNNWLINSNETTQDLFSLFFINSLKAWIVGEGGVILITHNCGSSWEILKIGTENYLHSVYFANSDTGWVVGNNGSIIKTTDGGSTWIIQQSNTTDNLQYVQFIDSRTGWAIGNASILKTIDVGKTWINQANELSSLNTAFFIDSNIGWVADYFSGEILKTENGGEQWKIVNEFPLGHIWSIYFIDEMTGWISGLLGIQKTSDGGSSWHKQEIGNDRDYWSIYFLDENLGWAIGSSILKTVDGGNIWSRQVSPSSGNSIFFVNDHTGWAVGGYGSIINTSSGGVFTYVKKISYDNILSNYELNQNFPNPFNSETKIKYHLQNKGHISIKIYNILGQLVKTIVDENKIAGNHTVIWNGKDSLDNYVASGLYIYSLQAEGKMKLRKMILIR